MEPEESISAASHPQEAWASGEAYEVYMGRWSRLAAQAFLSWLQPAPGGRWLDVGCGAGALSQAILQGASPSKLQGIDRSADFIAYVQRRIHHPQARFEVGDAQALAAGASAFDVAVSGLMLNFLPQPALALREMLRVVASGGVVAVYVWDYASKMHMLRHFWNAVIALDPQAAALDEGRRFPLCRPAALAELFRTAGLEQIETHAIEIATDFKNFDDYWLPFLGGQGPAPGYVRSQDEAGRTALRERLRAGLPFALDGSIPLVARAWAVRGRRV